jgi:hypothetical protein
VKAGLSVRDAARSAGVSPGAVYRSKLFKALPRLAPPEKVERVKLTFSVPAPTADKLRARASAAGTTLSALVERLLDAPAPRPAPASVPVSAPATPPASPDAAPTLTFPCELVRDGALLMVTCGDDLTVVGNTIDEVLAELVEQAQRELDTGNALRADAPGSDWEGRIDLKVRGRNVIGAVVVREPTVAVPALPAPVMFVPDQQADNTVLVQRAAEIDGQVSAIEARLAQFIGQFSPDDPRIARAREVAAKQIASIRGTTA